MLLPPSPIRAGLDDRARLQALEDSGLDRPEPDVAYDRLTALATRLLGVPVSLITLIDDRRAFVKSAVGFDVALTEEPAEHSFCKHVVLSRAPFVVEDVANDVRVRDYRVARDHGVGAYCGVPLTTSDGHVLGALCAIDTFPRVWRSSDVELLAELAAGAIAETELRALNARLRQREAELAETTTRLEMTFDHAPIGMALTSLDGRWLKVNRAMCDMLEYDAHELLHLTFSSLTHPEDLSRDLHAVRRLLAGEMISYRIEKRYIGRSGREIWVDLSVTLLRDSAGLPLHFVAQVSDISERRAAEQSLQLERAALADAQRLARLGTWKWNTITGESEWSSGMYLIFGRDPDSGPPRSDSFFSYLHPSDRARFEAQVDALGGRRQEFRIDGQLESSERWILAIGRRDRNHAGVYTGTVQDVTELREAELEAAHWRDQATIGPDQTAVRSGEAGDRRLRIVRD